MARPIFIRTIEILTNGSISLSQDIVYLKNNSQLRINTWDYVAHGNMIKNQMRKEAKNQKKNITGAKQENKYRKRFKT